jgi:hypothetical protein
MWDIGCLLCRADNAERPESRPSVGDFLSAIPVICMNGERAFAGAGVDGTSRAVVVARCGEAAWPVPLSLFAAHKGATGFAGVPARLLPKGKTEGPQ